MSTPQTQLHTLCELALAECERPKVTVLIARDQSCVVMVHDWAFHKFYGETRFSATYDAIRAVDQDKLELRVGTFA